MADTEKGAAHKDNGQLPRPDRVTFLADYDPGPLVIYRVPRWLVRCVLALVVSMALLAADAVSERLVHGETIERVEALERVVEALRAAGYVEVE